jgi:endoribonuclease Dicer
LESLTHCSYNLNKLTNSCERLEFLGDAVIDYLVSCHLFSKYPGLSPGDLTNLRSALVNNNALARLSVDSGLYRHLLYASPKLLAKIDEYVTHIKSGDSDNTGDSGGFRAVKMLENLKLINEEDCPVLEDVEVPKVRRFELHFKLLCKPISLFQVLGDVVEAVMGAIYLDSGFDLGVVWSRFCHLFPYMEDVVKKKPKSPVVILMERFPEKTVFRKMKRTERGKANVIVEVLVDNGEKFLFRGLGNVNKRAKDAAARCATRELTKRGMF